ncbi:protein jag [Lentibacillus lipolyticus]|nr:protein jag [Lentibacillus lipolyticus]
MREITASGQTVEEAVQSALEQLDTTRDQVEVDIVDEGKRGILGIFGSKQAIVNVSMAADPVEDVRQYLQQIAENMGIQMEITANVTGNQVIYDMDGDNIAMMIGKRGQTLNALQYLAHLAINKDRKVHYVVTVDAQGYRARRKGTLESLADKMANKAIQTDKEVILEPMPAFERKIVHHALQDNEQVTTASEGLEPNRHIVIRPL